MIFKKTLLMFVVFFSVNAALAISSQLVNDDRQLIQAMASRKNAHFVEAGNIKVTQLLPDDRQGLPHQKWMAQLSNGSKVMVVYNLDMGAYVPVRVGDAFSVGGQFIWTKQGGLVHWTHKDPRRTRPDGYVYFDGTYYGE